MRSIIKIAPSASTVLYNVEVMDEVQVGQACQKASAAFSSWRNTTVGERKHLLSNLITIIQAHKEQIIETIMRDVEKPYCEAETEIIEGCDIISFYCNEEYDGIDEPKEINLDNQAWPEKKAYTLYQPVGVYAVIKPWNYPFELNLWAIAPLLLAGNTIVYKPSELSTATGLLLSELINCAGFPDGVFNTVTGDGETGRLLVKNRNIRGISFTGSSKVGHEIQELRKDISTKLSLEMGGSDYAIVLNDQNSDITIPGILWGSFTNAGQVCVSTERILIASDIYTSFRDDLVREAKKLRMKTEIPPIISEKQFNHATAIIEDAILHGCKVLCGGIDHSMSNAILPTVIECVDFEYLNNIGEIFAPIVFVAPFTDEQIAINLVNKSSYGLGCSIWTENYHAHSHLLKQLDVGMIWVNEVNLPMPQVPWIGRRESGIGFNLAKTAVYDSMEIKAIHVDLDNNKRFWWYPYND